jgi:oxygen-dependent protoporphyrinogen oxidase
VGYTEKVVVIGAGLSGLACAYRLQQLGLAPLVLEAADRPGGVISSIQKNGFLFESGPQFPRFPAGVWQLVRELHLEPEFLRGDPRAQRFIFHNGRLHRAPFSPDGLLATGLVGLRSKWHVLTEPLRHTRPPDYEETLAQFVERKFGSEILDHLVDPFISTIFFGDAHQMGMHSAFPALVEWERHTGSLVRGALRARSRNRRNSSLRVTDSLPTLGSFRSGTATLPRRLAAALGSRLRFQAAILSLTQQPASTLWQITLAGGEQILAQQLILAIPAYAAAQLLLSTLPDLATHLAAIEYAPICVVSAAYDRSRVAHPLHGFGFMVPRREKLSTICTFWNSSLFANRAPQSAALITSFAARQLADQFSSLSEDDCAKVVHAENAKILGITAPPLDCAVWKDLRALPQYNVGHARRVTAISAILTATPSLHVIGNFLHGRSIGDCTDLADAVASKVHSQLAGPNI